MENSINIDISLGIKKAQKDIDKLKKEFKQLNTSIDSKNVNEFEKNLKKTNVTSESLIGSLSKLGLLVGGTALFGAGIKSVADFEESISKLGAISQASSDDLDKMKKKALELGKSTQFSSTQVSEAMNYLAMAGLKTNDILKSTKDVLNLATVGQMDLARASDILSNVLSGFGLSAEKLGNVVDVMSATITNSNTNVEQLGEAFKYVSPQAKAMGISINDTATAIGVLSNNGLQGSLAGTGLAQVLSRLSAPVGKAKTDLEKLGIQVYDSKGKFLGLKNVLVEFNNKMKDMSQQDKAKYIQDIFGQEAMKSALTLINNVDSGYTKLNEKINKSAGLSAKISKQMNDNLKGDWKKLLSALDGLAQSIGQDLLPALRKFTQFLTSSVTDIQNFYSENRVLIKTISELAITFYSLNKIMKLSMLLGGSGMALKLKEAMTGVTLLTGAIRGLKVVIMSLGLANPVLLSLSVAIAGVLYYINDLEESTKKLNSTSNMLNSDTKKLNGSIDELYSKHFNKATKQLELTNEELKKYKKNNDDLIKTTKKQIEEAKKNSDGSVEYKNIISELNKKLKLLQDTQKGLNSAKIIQNTKDVTHNTNKQTQSVKELTNAQKNYIKSLDDELKKEKKKKQTLEEWYQYQLKKLNDMLGGTQEYYNEVEKLNEIYRIKLKNSEKKQLNDFKNTYSKRITEHTNTINKLEDKEKTLANKIIDIQRDLQNKLKAIDLQRTNDIESIENKIHGIQVSGLSDYQKYNDKKKQSDIIYNKAKLALQNGELSQAKKYMGQYESLVSGLANTEIKENGKVLVSKKQSNAEAIKGLKSLETLTNSYYDKEKAKEIETHNTKIEQLRVELEATKAQIQMDTQRLELEKKLVETLTGKKIDIDTSSALKSVKNIDKQIKALDNQKTNPKIKVSADTTKAKDTITKMTDSISHKVTTIKVHSDISKAMQTLNEIPKVIVTEHIIKTVEKHNNGGVVGEVHKFATGGKIDDFKRKSGRIGGYDPTDSDDVPAMLTRGEFVVKRDTVKHYGDDFLYKLNNKSIPKFATGGLVEENNPFKNLITNTTSSNTDNSTNEIDFSKLDDYLKTLNEFKDKFKEYGYNGFNSKINDEVSNITKLKNKYNEDEKSLTNTTNSVKNKTLTETEYNSYKSKKDGLSKNVELDKINIKKLEDDVEKFIDKINNYLKKVEDIKAKIDTKLQTLNIDEKELGNFKDSYDFDKLNNFYNKLNSSDLLTDSKIQTKFNDISNNYLSAYRKAYYSNFYIKDLTRLPQKPTGRDFVKELGINNDSLITKYNNLFKSVSPSSFGGAPTINKTILNETKIDYLKEHLPKFQTGGLNGLNGGKLNGYGGGDRNLALLEDGEFIVRKEAVSHFGADFLHSVNNIKLPKFNVGGMINFDNLPKFQTGGLNGANNGNTTNINFTMPSGNSYNMMSSEDVANALSQEFRSL